MLLAIPPGVASYQQTFSALKLASKVKHIKTEPYTQSSLDMELISPLHEKTLKL
jgi:hypothetical protein